MTHAVYIAAESMIMYFRTHLGRPYFASFPVSPSPHADPVNRRTKSWCIGEGQLIQETVEIYPMLMWNVSDSKTRHPAKLTYKQVANGHRLSSYMKYCAGLQVT